MPFLGHSSKGAGWSCRKRVKDNMKEACLERITAIGNLFGRDRVVVCTVAFGPQKEDFMTLQEMAETLPRGSFQKLGLNPAALRTAFSSLFSSMTELRTEGGSRSLTLRTDVRVNRHQKMLHGVYVKGSEGWFVYSHKELLGKFRYDKARQALVKADLTPRATGFAFFGEAFAVGAERVVYRCTEVEIPRDKYREWYFNTHTGSTRMVAQRVGLRFVAKEAKDKENLLLGRAFHEQFARVQEDASALARKFNAVLRGPAAWHVEFLPVFLYEVFDINYKDNVAWVLVEPELDGRFTKWNNNGGAVLRARGIRTDCHASAAPSHANPEALKHARALSSLTGRARAEGDGLRSGADRGLGLGLGSILEDEDEDEDGDSDVEIDVDEVPQAFSHFSYEASGGKQLVCDLQGTWNSHDGFVLTDPVVHYVSSRNPHRKHKNGATDKGRDGVDRFFKTHKCGPLCARLGLQRKAAAYLKP